MRSCGVRGSRKRHRHRHRHRHTHTNRNRNKSRLKFISPSKVFIYSEEAPFVLLQKKGAFLLIDPQITITICDPYTLLNLVAEPAKFTVSLLRRSSSLSSSAVFDDSPAGSNVVVVVTVVMTSTHQWVTLPTDWYPNLLTPGLPTVTKGNARGQLVNAF